MQRGIELRTVVSSAGKSEQFQYSASFRIHYILYMIHLHKCLQRYSNIEGAKMIADGVSEGTTKVKEGMVP